MAHWRSWGGGGGVFGRRPGGPTPEGKTLKIKNTKKFFVPKKNKKK